jgi:hypothetical protein
MRPTQRVHFVGESLLAMSSQAARMQQTSSPMGTFIGDYVDTQLGTQVGKAHPNELQRASVVGLATCAQIVIPAPSRPTCYNSAMQLQRLEARVLGLVEHALDHRRIEDDRVECKAVWPTDHRKAARQIAGLANAAAGEPVLWLVGLDEDAGLIVETGAVEPSAWWGQTRKTFTEVSPEVTWLQVPIVGRGIITALQFSTDRAPYLVTTDGRGGVDREIPWRSAGSTRSAHRSEILRAVVGEAQVPQIEPILGHCRVTTPSHFDGQLKRPSLKVSYYADAFVEAIATSTLPKHRWDLRLQVGDHNVPLRGDIEGPQKYVGTTAGPGVFGGAARFASIGSITSVSDSGLHIAGSDRITLELEADLLNPTADLIETVRHAQRVRLVGEFPLALSSRVARIKQTLRRVRLAPIGTFIGDYVDTRLGEFTQDGRPHPDEYYGDEP